VTRSHATIGRFAALTVLPSLFLLTGLPRR
jgi:hypothetical protein